MKSDDSGFWYEAKWCFRILHEFAIIVSALSKGGSIFQSVLSFPVSVVQPEFILEGKQFLDSSATVAERNKSLDNVQANISPVASVNSG